MINPLMANDAFKRFHLLEKAQFSQEKVQMCENHQICRADIGEKNPHFFGLPPALKCTQGVHEKVSSPRGRVVLVWLLRGHRLYQFVSLGGS